MCAAVQICYSGLQESRMRTLDRGRRLLLTEDFTVVREFGGQMPRTAEDLQKLLPGVAGYGRRRWQRHQSSLPPYDALERILPPRPSLTPLVELDSASSLNNLVNGRANTQTSLISDVEECELAGIEIGRHVVFGEPLMCRNSGNPPIITETLI
ncbi:unnamed protein product [Ranitomeya imitator]|uniref:Uncharacterized protein n=1 Tax=Ranitomeya imitator TaxID=111125 RepID=A0ABN9M1V3_9NEOB|nr:unnamed protein product [Ranitomeya imitator]